MNVAEIYELPTGRVLFSDAEGRVLRATWHLDRGLVNLSVWNDDRCTETFRLSLGDAAQFVAFLVEGLSERDVSPAPRRQFTDTHHVDAEPAGRVDEPGPVGPHARRGVDRPRRHRALTDRPQAWTATDSSSAPGAARSAVVASESGMSSHAALCAGDVGPRRSDARRDAGTGPDDGEGPVALIDIERCAEDRRELGRQRRFHGKRAITGSVYTPSTMSCPGACRAAVGRGDVQDVVDDLEHDAVGVAVFGERVDRDTVVAGDDRPDARAAVP